MRRHPQQNFTLAQRRVHEAERAVLQIAQAAMDQLRRRRRRAGRKVVLLDQHDLQPAPGSVARDAGAVDAAADDSEIEIGHAVCAYARYGTGGEPAPESPTARRFRSSVYGRRKFFFFLI